MCIISLAQSQNTKKLHPNCNGGVLPLTQEELDAIPILNISPPSAQLSLPLKVDNSQLPYMPDIFEQKNGSCTQASTIQYTFSYEMNRLRGTSPQNNNYHNHFHHLSTFNHVKEPSSEHEGIYFARWTDGWNMAKEIGLPDYATYGNWDNDITYWMDGYDNCRSRGQYRVEDYYHITVHSNGDGLDDLKHWLHDHGNAENTGGLANLIMSGDIEYFQGTGEFAGETIISATHTDCTFHAVTVVGYDDTFKQDLNGDGLYTNDIDLNGDEEIDIKDWEKGALKIVNSYGANWPEFSTDNHGNGYFYLPYRFIIQPKQIPTPDSLNKAQSFHICKVKTEQLTDLGVKVQVISNDRRVPKVLFYYGENADDEMAFSDMPHSSNLYYNSPSTDSINEVPMQGQNRSDTIELYFDFATHFGDKDFGKIFTHVRKSTYVPEESVKIGYFSLIDYRWGEEFEIYCDVRDYEIPSPPYTPNNFPTLSINYDLLPFEINEDLTVRTDMISRFSPTVHNGATLKVDRETKIDMYNSELIIEPGATLFLGDNVVFTAKRGVSKIIVYGDLQLGNHVQFMA
ncbi:MAG: hypothetical protein CR982_10860, partial [Candidatus Cloacimonadota bacterium]